MGLEKKTAVITGGGRGIGAAVANALAEVGSEHAELRGVVIYGVARIDPDTECVLDALQQVAKRNTSAGDADPTAVREGLRPMARKRVAIRVEPEKVVSWDHRKLGGVY